MLLDEFRLTQMPEGFDGSVRLCPSSAAEARAALEAGGSGVTDKLNAALLTQVLGVSVKADPTRPQLHPEDQVVVAEYFGTRPKHGTTQLPEGAGFHFFLVSVGHPENWIVKA